MTTAAEEIWMVRASLACPSCGDEECFSCERCSDCGERRYRSQLVDGLCRECATFRADHPELDEGMGTVADPDMDGTNVDPDRIPTRPDGVPVTMAQIVGGSR